MSLYKYKVPLFNSSCTQVAAKYINAMEGNVSWNCTETTASKNSIQLIEFISPLNCIKLVGIRLVIINSNGKVQNNRQIFASFFLYTVLNTG